MRLKTDHAFLNINDASYFENEYIILKNTGIYFYHKNTLEQSFAIDDCYFGTNLCLFGGHYLAVSFSNTSFRIYDLHDKKQISSDYTFRDEKIAHLEFELSKDEKKLYVLKYMHEDQLRQSLMIFDFPTLKNEEVISAEKEGSIGYCKFIDKIFFIRDNSFYFQGEEKPLFREQNELNFTCEDKETDSFILLNPKEIIVIDHEGKEKNRFNLIEELKKTTEKNLILKNKVASPLYIILYANKLKDGKILFEVLSRAENMFFLICIYDIYSNSLVLVKPCSELIINSFTSEDHICVVTHKTCFLCSLVSETKEIS